MFLVEKFVTLGVEMLPPLSGNVDVGPCDLTKLTDGLHSKEALELVKEHLLTIMGPVPQTLPSQAMIRSAKLQSAQIYAASLMVGLASPRQLAALPGLPCQYVLLCSSATS